MLLSHRIIHHFPSIRPYHMHVTAASRLSALVTHSHHHLFLFLCVLHLYPKRHCLSRLVRKRYGFSDRFGGERLFQKRRWCDKIRRLHIYTTNEREKRGGNCS